MKSKQPEGTKPTVKSKQQAESIIVIADDITGAAEIAGIAFERGLQSSLTCGFAVGCGSVATPTNALAPNTGTPPTATARATVIATDTRSMTESEAVTHTKHLAFLIPHSSLLIFKKTDSALRGHVVAELTALMEWAGFRRTVFLPANPSKGRIIRAGTYYIIQREGTILPLHQTAFSYDPEYPATTSVLRERFPDAESKGIIMPDAECADDIRRVVATYDDGETLFAGAADLFAALLEQRLPSHHTPFRKESASPAGQGSPSPLFNKAQSTLILCGSTQSKFLDLGIPVAPMPREIYDGNEDISLWDTSTYPENHSLILTMPYSHRTGKDAAVYLRSVMARKTKQLMAQRLPDHLIIEGGATAWATLHALGWTQFNIVCQIAPGVVQMRAYNGTLVTLKPGSYAWNGQF